MKKFLNYSRFKDERYQRNTHEKKIRSQVVPTRKTFGPTTYPQENNSDQRSVHEKNFGTLEVPTRKTLGPTKYPWEKTSDPRNIHEKKFWTHERRMAQWHETHETQDGTITPNLVVNIFDVIYGTLL